MSADEGADSVAEEKQPRHLVRTEIDEVSHATEEREPMPPYHEALSTTWQTIATVVLWTATAGLLAWAVKMAREERSPFPILVVAAVASGSLIEPLYDTSYHTYWLDHGQQWTLFTAFHIPQPVWVMPAYVMVFACPALLLYRRLARGASMAEVFRFAGLFACTTAAFEIGAVNIPLYKYYGHAPLRVAGYPLWIAFMESAQITGYAVLCAALKLRATKPSHSLALFVIFPANFAFECLGAGFLALMALNTTRPQQAVMTIAALASIGCAATGLWWTARLLQTVAPATQPEPPGAEVAGARILRPA